VGNFSKACRETKCLNVDIGTFPFENLDNLPQRTTTNERLPLFVMFIQLFFLYLTDESKCRFDFGVFSVRYMDVWEGQEFKTFEPVSWLPIFIYYLPHFAFLLYFHCSYFTFSIPIFFIGSNHRVSKDCRTQDCAISFK
jgi:hypothetical protein